MYYRKTRSDNPVLHGMTNENLPTFPVNRPNTRSEGLHPSQQTSLILSPRPRYVPTFPVIRPTTSSQGPVPS